MSSAKYGLLQGLGQGVAQAGNMLMIDALDRQKEERLQKYQQQMQKQQWDRDDKHRDEDQSYRTGRDIKTDAHNAAQLENQAKTLTIRQEESTAAINKVNQELEIGKLTLSQAERLEAYYGVIGNPESTPAEVDSAKSTLIELTSSNPTLYSSFIHYKEDEFGNETRETWILNKNTGEERRAGGAFGQPSSQDSAAELREVLGLGGVGGEDGSAAPESKPKSPERMAIETQKAGAESLRLKEASVARVERELSRIESAGSGSSTGSRQGQYGLLKTNDHTDKLLDIIENGNATPEQVQRARTLLNNRK